MRPWTGSAGNGLSPVRRQAITWTKCSLIVNLTLRNTVQCNANRNTKLSIHENAFENVVCEMAVILSWVRWVNLKIAFRATRCLLVPQRRQRPGYLHILFMSWTRIRGAGVAADFSKQGHSKYAGLDSTHLSFDQHGKDGHAIVPYTSSVLGIPVLVGFTPLISTLIDPVVCGDWSLNGFRVTSYTASYSTDYSNSCRLIGFCIPTSIGNLESW